MTTWREFNPACPNCSRILVKKIKPAKKRIFSSYCSWCKQHFPARQSKRSSREKKK